MSSPFEYPRSPLVRRHEPRGYQQASSYRPWLRDEFAFRCAFCLIRETWLPADLEVDHFAPVARAVEQELDYLNLLYACRTCNAKKGDQSVPDPSMELLRDEITIANDGLLIARSPRAKELILALGLNTRRQREYRRLMTDIVELARVADPGMHHRLMGYPDELPELTSLRPPGGNARPEGATSSFHSRRERGELPDTY